MINVEKDGSEVYGLKLGDDFLLFRFVFEHGLREFQC